MKTRAGLALAVLFVLRAASAQAQEAAAAGAAPDEKAQWEYSASVYGYFIPEGQAVIWRGPMLHRLDATLMAGGVFGDTRGVAPGYELTLSYGRFELYSEGEYVFDTQDKGNSFFYNWAQLGYSPLEWLTVGLASQRTRAYQTSLDVQRGFFVGFTCRNVKLNVFVFNPGWETPTVVTSLAVSF